MEKREHAVEEPISSSTNENSGGCLCTMLGLVLGAAIGVGVGFFVWGGATPAASEAVDPIQTSRFEFAYDPEISPHTRKTNSYMPFMPILDGWMQTHHTYRFFTVREQVMTAIGEAKHGVWRIQDNGMVRLYRKAGVDGVPVGADVMDPELFPIIEDSYKAILAPYVGHL